MGLVRGRVVVKVYGCVVSEYWEGQVRPYMSEERLREGNDVTWRG